VPLTWWAARVSIPAPLGLKVLVRACSVLHTGTPRLELATQRANSNRGCDARNGVDGLRHDCWDRSRNSPNWRTPAEALEQLVAKRH